MEFELENKKQWGLFLSVMVVGGAIGIFLGFRYEPILIMASLGGLWLGAWIFWSMFPAK